MKKTAAKETRDHLQRLHELIDRWFGAAEDTLDDQKARTIAQLIREARGIAKLEADSKGLTDAEWVEQFRSMDLVRRERLLRELGGIGKKGSGLA